MDLQFTKRTPTLTSTLILKVILLRITKSAGFKVLLQEAKQVCTTDSLPAKIHNKNLHDGRSFTSLLETIKENYLKSIK